MRAYGLEDLQMKDYVAKGLAQIEIYLAKWAAFEVFYSRRKVLK